MKKTSIFCLAAVFLLLMGVAPSASAQYVNVGSGDDNNYTVPLHNYYNHSITQTIYLSSEMGGSANIHSISYQHYAADVTDSCYRDVKVYLAHTNKTSFSNDNDWVTSVGTLVYEGPLFIPNTTFDEWVTIMFDQSFAYNGTSNLIVTIVDDAVSTYADNHYYESTDCPSSMCLYAFNDETAYSTSNMGSIADDSEEYSASSLRPNTRFFTSSSSSLSYIEVGGDGEQGTTNCLPTYGFYNNTVTQQIFLNSEVGGDGTALYGIQFYHKAASASSEVNRHIRLYADWNGDNEFTSNTDWLEVWSSGLVFEGTLVLPGGGEEGWITIWFNQPYVSESGHNLVIAMDADDDDWESGHTFRSHTTDNAMAIYKYSDTITYDATEMYNSGISGTTTATRNTVRFITAQQQAPSEPLYVTLTAPATGQANEDVPVQADYPDDVVGYEWYAEDHSDWTNTSATGANVKWKVGGTYKVRITVSRNGETAADSAMITISPFEPQTTVTSTTKWYGNVVYSENDLNGQFVKFGMQHPEQAESISEQISNVSSAEYVDGQLYFFSIDDFKIYKTSFSPANPNIVTYDEVGSTGDVNINEMSYNYVDNTMYGIVSGRLVSIDLATGELTTIGALENNLQTFAINNQGVAYGISNTEGILYRVNLADATLTQVGSTGRGCKYVQSMAFDRGTGELFWAQYSLTENGFCKVNTTTGQADYIGFMDNGTIEMTGLFMVPGAQGIQAAGNVEVDVYPNPTTDKVVVDAADLMYVVVLDLNGRAVMTSHESTVDLGDQPAGIYMLRIVTTDGTVLRKVVKK